MSVQQAVCREQTRVLLSEDHDNGGRPRHARARVLLVEDDDAMRQLVAEALRRDGYDVLEASSGLAAAQLIEDMTLREWSAGAFDLVVSDVCMAGLNGLRLGEMLRDARWDVPVIFITAFPEEHVRECAERIGATVIAKPFRLEVLRRSVLTTIAAHVKEAHAKEGGGALP
jgi:DNA-binding response OmpR family regulator